MSSDSQSNIPIARRHYSSVKKVQSQLGLVNVALFNVIMFFTVCSETFIFVNTFWKLNLNLRFQKWGKQILPEIFIKYF